MEAFHVIFLMPTLPFSAIFYLFNQFRRPTNFKTCIVDRIFIIIVHGVATKNRRFGNFPKQPSRSICVISTSAISAKLHDRHDLIDGYIKNLFIRPDCGGLETKEEKDYLVDLLIARGAKGTLFTILV